VSPAQWIDCYSAALGIQGSVSPALRRAAADRAAEAAGLARGERGLCHSDLHVLNVIDRGPPPGTQPAHSREQGSLVLLDFEYAHVSDPFWDLAGWSANNDFEPELAWALAEAYRGRPPTSSERSRLDLNRWLYDYVCLLWSELYLRRDADPEISARARLIEARLAGALG
jgi:thiamine kinase-like enzyme